MPTIKKLLRGLSSIVMPFSSEKNFELNYSMRVSSFDYNGSWVHVDPAPLSLTKYAGFCPIVSDGFNPDLRFFLSRFPDIGGQFSSPLVRGCLTENITTALRQ
jgi:hypothetical protein